MDFQLFLVERHLHLLKQLGDLLIFECNYAIKDLPIISTFYRVLLLWWSEFRDLFFEEKCWLSVIWNNKDIRNNGKPVFQKIYYKTYYSGICTVDDLLLNLHNINSFEIIRKKSKSQFFYMDWSQTLYIIQLKTAEHRLDRRLSYFKCNNFIFDISKRNRKTSIH